MWTVMPMLPIGMRPYSHLLWSYLYHRSDSFRGDAQAMRSFHHAGSWKAQQACCANSNPEACSNLCGRRFVKPISKVANLVNAFLDKVCASSPEGHQAPRPAQMPIQLGPSSAYYHGCRTHVRPCLHGATRAIHTFPCYIMSAWARVAYRARPGVALPSQLQLCQLRMTLATANMHYSRWCAM